MRRPAERKRTELGVQKGRVACIGEDAKAKEVGEEEGIPLLTERDRGGSS